MKGSIVCLSGEVDLGVEGAACQGEREDVVLGLLFLSVMGGTIVRLASIRGGEGFLGGLGPVLLGETEWPSAAGSQAGWWCVSPAEAGVSTVEIISFDTFPKLGLLADFLWSSCWAGFWVGASLFVLEGVADSVLMFTFSSFPSSSD